MGQWWRGLFFPQQQFCDTARTLFSLQSCPCTMRILSLLTSWFPTSSKVLTNYGCHLFTPPHAPGSCIGSLSLDTLWTMLSDILIFCVCMCMCVCLGLPSTYSISFGNDTRYFSHTFLSRTCSVCCLLIFSLSPLICSSAFCSPPSTILLSLFYILPFRVLCPLVTCVYCDPDLDSLSFSFDVCDMFQNNDLVIMLWCLEWDDNGLSTSTVKSSLTRASCCSLEWDQN